MSYILDFSYICLCVMLSPSKEVAHMMNENDFIILYLNASDEIKNQIEKVLAESQQHSEFVDWQICIIGKNLMPFQLPG